MVVRPNACLSVCLYVCLNKSEFCQKQLNIGSWKRHTIARDSSFFAAKELGKIPTGSLPKDAPNTVEVG